MKVHEPKRCIICGREYIPKRSDQRCCLDPKCLRERQRINQREYRERNYGKVLESNRKASARKRAEKRMEDAQLKDNIVAIGYAERQRAQTLRMVGRIKVEL